jgi:hypothetical protein
MDSKERADKSGLSPIRDLQEYYSRVIAKISGKGRSLNHLMQTPDDVLKVERTPPKINSARKKITVIDSSIMEKFAPEAFRFNLSKDPSRAPTQTHSRSPSKERPEVNKRTLLRSLADAVEPSIEPDQAKDLGKPSARQDAILLTKWFHDIIEVIETTAKQPSSLFKPDQVASYHYL